MKRLAWAVLMVAVLMAFVATASPVLAAPKACNTIASGLIHDTKGNTVVLGFDQFGYNYQAHQFVGTYDSSDRVLDGKYWGSAVDYADDMLMMKWSDDWLASVDCNGDGLLDRGLVNGVVGGVSLGWLTNHVNGDYIDTNGVAQHYTDFTKIGYTGPGGGLWGVYTILMDVYNDPAGGYRGAVHYADPGLGHYVTR